MTEQEYVDATNLAKVRAAKAVLRDTLPNEGQHTAFYESAMAALTAWEYSLALLARVSEGKGDGNG